VDTNANGELDADEVAREEAICHGVDGQDGTSCRAEPNDDGSYTIVCPDSDPILFVLS